MTSSIYSNRNFLIFFSAKSSRFSFYSDIIAYLTIYFSNNKLLLMKILWYTTYLCNWYFWLHHYYVVPTLFIPSCLAIRVPVKEVIFTDLFDQLIAHETPHLNIAELYYRTNRENESWLTKWIIDFYNIEPSSYILRRRLC